MTAHWKTAWVVGGSSGLGAEVVKQITADGTKAYVSARNKKTLEGFCASLENAIPVKLDVSHEGECLQVVNEIVSTIGELPDLIILNAAIYTPMGCENFDPKSIADMMQVNYLGVVNMMAALLLHHQAGKKTTIAAVASPSGWSGLPGGVGYGPTKAALINLFEGLNAELQNTAFDLRIINPGFIRTRLTDLNDFPMPQLMEPEDAGRRLLSGLKKNGFEISFPNPFILFLKLLHLLPYWLYFKLVRKKS